MNVVHVLFVVDRPVQIFENLIDAVLREMDRSTTAVVSSHVSALVSGGLKANRNTTARQHPCPCARPEAGARVQRNTCAWRRSHKQRQKNAP